MLEALLLGIAFYSLFTGKLPQVTMWGRGTVRGTRARLIGSIGLLPIPLTFIISIVIVMMMSLLGRPIDERSFLWIGVGIECTIALSCIVAIVFLSRRFHVPKKPQQESDLSRGR